MPALCCVPAITRSDALTQSSCHLCMGTRRPCCYFAFFLFSQPSVYFWPDFKNIGAAGFAVYSGPSFKGTSGMFHWILQRFTGHMGSYMAAKLKAQIRCHDVLLSIQSEGSKLHNKIQASGFCCRQLCSTLTLFLVMLWSEEEENLSSGSELAT